MKWPFEFAAPAEPDAGELEALARVVNDWLLVKGWAATGDDIARAVLSSDWLAARDARVRREGETDGLRAAADAIENVRDHGLPPGVGSHPVVGDRWLRDRADRISR